MRGSHQFGKRSILRLHQRDELDGGEERERNARASPV